MAKLLILAPLFLLAVTSLFTILYMNSASSLSESAFGEGYDPENITSSYKQNLNETETELGSELNDASFVFSTATLFYSIIISAFSCLVAGSITVLGSTLGSGFGKTAGALVLYYGFWFIFSVGGLIGLLMIPLVGLLLYFFMSLMFTIGVYDEVS